jgi:hypothetical protein
MATWGNLNKRQQTYLRSVYEVDQLQEVNIKSLSTSGRWNHTPASEWRWMPYNAANAPLLEKIQGAGYRDEGTGSTFNALERRGLVLCKYETDSWGFQILFVQITKEGRKLVRDALGLTAPKAPVVGTLQEWHWRALAKAYATGSKGVGDGGGSSRYGRIGWNTWLRLRDYKIKGTEYPLVEASGGMRITGFGIAFYERTYARYCEMFPAVSAPAPAQVLDPCEPYVEIIQDSRICRACDGRYLVAVTRTYRQDLRWTWSVEEQDQRIPGIVTSRYGAEIEQCACQEADIQELVEPLLSLLDRLSAQGYQVRFPLHHWYSYLEYIVGTHQRGGDMWYDPALVRQKLLPLLDDAEMPDDRNIMKGNVRYCYNERVGKGCIYPHTAPGNFNTWPIARTRKQLMDRLT